MEVLRCDQRGRVLLPKAVREEYGKEFVLVKAPKELVLLPAPRDALKDLARMGREAGLHHYSLKAIKKMIGEEAVREVRKSLG